jgi:hypothetical protein
VTYGAAVPAITASYSGFVNGETSAVLTTLPTCITAYTTSSKAGSSPSTSCSGAAAANYTFSYVNGSVIVNQALPTITLASSLNPILLQTQVTYTATVSSTAGKPAGTVAFSDGGTSITACASAAVTASSGNATCTVTYTATGTHSITATYSGDTNFLTVGPSNTVPEAAVDITLSSTTSGGGSSPVLTILPGGSATESLSIVPSSGTSIPLPLTMTVAASPSLPAGTTMSVTPSSWSLTSNNPWTWTLPAGTVLSGNTVLTIKLPQNSSFAQSAGGAGSNFVSHLAPFSLALLLLPFAGRLRKSGIRLGRLLTILLLAVAGMAAVAGMNGCGVEAHKSYSITITASSGSLSHSTTSTLIVE